jgi:polyisoprenoid-binding protein YceI
LPWRRQLRFEQIEAGITVAEDPLFSYAQATISTASITTGTEDRDAHLNSADFLDVEAFLTMTYVSRAIRPSGSGPKWSLVNGTMRRRRRDANGVTVLGDLTIRDVTRPIELDVSLDGVTSGTSPSKQEGGWCRRRSRWRSGPRRSGRADRSPRWPIGNHPG